MIDTTTIHVTKPLSSSMIVEIFDTYPNLEEITCSPSIYSRTSKKYVKALNKLGVEVNIKRMWGAKSKTNGAEFEVLELYNKGNSVNKIAEELNLTIDRAYYLLKKAGADLSKRQRKYDYNTVYILSRDGLSAQEISEKLDIPLRTVYYILNKNKTEQK